METSRQNVSCLLLILKNSLTVPPPVGSEKQCHGKEFFSIRRRSVSVFRAIRRTGPGKITFIFPGIHPHISLCPFPEAVKLLLHIELHAHHHAVRHALRPRIIVSGILYISHIIPHRMIYLFLIIIEESVDNFLPSLRNLFL